jgi:pimeloyl-ACP methyl ester carboxylesterase
VPGSVTAGRATFGRRAWRDADDHLAAAGRDDLLGSDDLERLATTAYLIGAEDADTTRVDDLLAAPWLGWPLRVIENAAHAPHVEQPQAFVEELERIVGALCRR